MEIGTSKQKTQSVKVVVHGAFGRAGQTAIDILCRGDGTDVVGIVDICVKHTSYLLPDESREVPSSIDLESILTACKPDVIVDFTEPSATMEAVRISARHGVNMVIGTTGLSDSQLEDIDDIGKKADVGVLTGTLSLGVALTAHLASIAAHYFNHAEIVDLGKQDKLDAPSGAAIDIARAMTTARGKPFERPHPNAENQACRGGRYEGVTVHSLRLSDCYIHEQVCFGSPAGTLVKIGVELTSEAYMNPAIIIAVREVGKLKGLVYGMDKLLLNAGKVTEGCG